MTPGDRFIQGLTDRLKTTVLSSKAYSTSSQYHRAFRKWKEFAVCKLNETSFPADPFHVALYLQHLIEQAHPPSVIDSAFHGIKWAHDMAGVPSPTDNSVVENVRSAAKRILGTAAVNCKEPISSELIRKIVSRANLDNPVDLRIVTMYVLCFTGFFRFDDISRVRRSDISFHEGFMVIQVQKSKNDQLRRGNEVVISELSSSACPVSLLKRYLDKLRIPPNSRDLIFKPISKAKAFCKLVSPDKPISYSSIRSIRDGFRRDLKNIGVDPSKFGLHSLRSGGSLRRLIMALMIVSFSVMAAGSLLRRKTFTLMIALSKDWQFLARPSPNKPTGDICNHVPGRTINHLDFIGNNSFASKMMINVNVFSSAMVFAFLRKSTNKNARCSLHYHILTQPWWSLTGGGRLRELRPKFFPIIMW